MVSSGTGTRTCWIWSLWPRPQASAPGPAIESEPVTDLAFVNGAVYTVDAVRRWAQAVAVSDGRISAVGTDAGIKDSVGPSTEVIDLAGRMLVPGFQDAHIHPVGSGL